MKLNNPLILVAGCVLGIGFEVAYESTPANRSLSVSASWALGEWSRGWVWYREQ